MEQRRLGTVSVSYLGIGCNAFGTRIAFPQVREVVDAAIDAGVNFFDTADVYGDGKSEVLLGKALGARRSEVVVATKFGHTMGQLEGSGASPEWIRRAVEGSLRRLNTDYIDLYQQHSPDPRTSLDATLETLDSLIVEGKVRQIGCSNFSPGDIAEAEQTASERKWHRFASIQDEWSLLNRRIETANLPVARRLGISILPYFPLAAGVLTGKYLRRSEVPSGTRLADPDLASRWLTEANMDRAERLADLARGRGHSLLELSLSWLVGQPNVASVLAGATSANQVAANVAALTWDLSLDELAEVDRITSARV